ncbi:hypothetical protein BDK51DRAFT_40633 [Blyttiomyces helicus]|uniref:Ankyrin repeat-containing domain protein n=1 Tax=Blyttiomyces helicus TaxID=388810 RepID=A0A4P9WBJ4_9FUNG|nr:hypothetical protein BDK51DRAFT_40633 [Blyttiomyces helicus]|eukprot:RKO89632.1 hypothetical protein BDK51DRAFT_40633 [Blyttiomyces helicus]
MDTAARAGRLDIVRFLHEHRSEGCTTAAMDAAAGTGRLAIVRFLYEHRSEGCTTNAIDDAIHVCAQLLRSRSTTAQGYKGVVLFLHRHRAEGSAAYAIESACLAGSVELVRDLLAVSPAINCSHVLALALAKEDVDMLRVMDEVGKRFPDEEVPNIRKRTSKDCLRAFLYEMHGFPQVRWAPLSDIRGARCDGVRMSVLTTCPALSSLQG